MRRIIVGNVPEPDELYGRQALIDHLWRQIAVSNVLLLAPRRFGKTGVMRHILKRPLPGYLPIYFDLEDVDGPDEFVWRLTREILAHDSLRSLLHAVRGLPVGVRDWFKDTFDEVSFEGAKVTFKETVADDWRTIARRILLELEKAGPTLIFILDELPAMLDRIRRKRDASEASDLMAWFRTVRMQQRDELRRHRFLVGGSIGIDVILRHIDSSDKLNDFERIAVEPLTPDEATRLVSDLARSSGVGLAPDLVPRILEQIGPPVPYFIHLLFSQLCQLPSERRSPLTPEVLDEIYRSRILGPTCKHYFDHYRARLSRYGKPLERVALSLLRAVAEAPSGRVGSSALYDIYRRARGRRAGEAEFSELLADLECEWYLALDARTNEYHFMVAVMRDWWRRWYGTPGKPGRVTRGR